MHATSGIFPRFARLALCAALSACGLAHATGSATATLSNLVITLTDLDPNDGVTPYFTIVNEGYDSSTFFGTLARASDQVHPDTIDSSAGGSGSFQHVEGTAGESWAYADYSGGVFTAHSQIGAASTESAHSTFALSGAGPGFYPEIGVINYASYDTLVNNASHPVELPERFIVAELSANTRIDIRAQAQLTASSTTNCEFCSTDQNAYAALRLMVENQIGYDTFEDAIAVYAWANEDTPVGTTVSSSDARDLHVSFVNDRNINGNPVWNRMSLSVGVLANGSASPAPEPGTWALVGLGLGAAAWMARRRRAG